MSILVATILAVSMFSFIGIGCGSNYLTGEKSRNVNGGGTLTSYAERQKDSASSVSGNARTVTYRVYADYSGSAKVTSIRTEWTIRATFKRPVSGSFNAGLTVGATEVGGNVGASSTNEWKDFSITKYWVNTNGTTHSFYGPSEYVLSPNNQVYSHALTNVAIVKVANHSTPTEVTVTV